MLGLGAGAIGGLGAAIGGGGATGAVGLGSILGGARDAFNVGAGIYNIYAAERARHDDATIRRQQYAREDTAVQRRVNDLVAAGLSPVLAAGGSAGSQPISSSARSPVPGIDTGALQAIRINRAQADALRAQEAKARQDVANGIALTKAQTDNLNAQSSQSYAQAAYMMKQLESLKHDLKLNEQRGTKSNETASDRFINSSADVVKELEKGKAKSVPNILMRIFQKGVWGSKIPLFE